MLRHLAPRPARSPAAGACHKVEAFPASAQTGKTTAPANPSSRSRSTPTSSGSPHASSRRRTPGMARRREAGKAAVAVCGAWRRSGQAGPHLNRGISRQPESSVPSSSHRWRPAFPAVTSGRHSPKGPTGWPRRHSRTDLLITQCPRRGCPSSQPAGTRNRGQPLHTPPVIRQGHHDRLGTQRHEILGRL